MARRASLFTQADVERAVKAARNAGMDVGALEITKDGTIRVIVGALMAESLTVTTPLEKWKAERDARTTEGT